MKKTLILFAALCLMAGNAMAESVKVESPDGRIVLTVNTDGALSYNVTFKGKTILAQAGEHMNLNAGYALADIKSDGSKVYTPTRNSSSWVCFSYGKKWQGILFAGYVQNFGTKDRVYGAAGENIYFSKNSFNNMNQMFRVTPAVLCNLGKFSYGVEYEVTGVQYGDKAKGMNLEKGLYDQDLHWVTNHRLQGIVKFTF